MLDSLSQPPENWNDQAACTIDELANFAVKTILSLALQQEVNDYVEKHADQRDERGRRLVVRNGLAKERKVACGAGTIAIKAPRINDRRKGHKFTSNILPPYLHKSRSIDAVIPALYLRELSGNTFQEGLEALQGCSRLVEKFSGIAQEAVARRTRCLATATDRGQLRLSLGRRCERQRPSQRGSQRLPLGDLGCYHQRREEGSCSHRRLP